MDKEKISQIYDKSYKILLVITLLIFIFGMGYLYSFAKTHGDIIDKDITLSGGTSIQVNSQTDIQKLESALSEKFEDFSIRQISNILTGEQIAVIIETSAPHEEIKSFLENYLGIELTSENSSIEFTGSTLSDSFYNQLRFAIALAFIFMAIVVFIIFRTFIPSLAVVFAAFSDIVLTLTTVNLLGIKMSTAGIVAFLMLIGYSVDTDILLTTRVLKRRGTPINERIYGAFKTGITMSLTSLSVVVVGLILTLNFSKVFSQIFTILTIGLIFDIFNTWLGNASLIKLYAEKKHLH
ncbi:MAG: protein translocase subunit SecF [Nanoarchaeota archaeon]|nr:protein translocase subunit SecF [Nanoarchaeota archaeon]